MGFDFVMLLVDQTAQLALHGFKGVVDHFGERRMGAFVQSSFVRDEFVAGRDGNIDPNAKRVSLLMRVIRLLDGDVAPVDVVAEFFKAGCFLEHEIVDGFGFIDTAVGDVNG